ncbi:N-6 DNA methylase [Dactylosporangium sp. NPDC005555]|uniref:Eco57I restriction-modification methylase domain-containing protein n=1 Tax=Dactylosporangium sp. NPDC005555 TaxID=3154889 RepID=UPI0033B15066
MAITTEGPAVAPGVQAGALPQHGEVFTRRWVVELILDLSDYTVEKDLAALTLLDPAVGGGAFLMVALERLLASRAIHRQTNPWSTLRNAIVAVDVQPRHVASCQEAVIARLRDEGCPESAARHLASTWIRRADFLLDDVTDGPVHVVVGNPPYVRIEDLPGETLTAYRKACPTMTGRADLYIGFFERALDLLAPDGRLGYICADRWMRNQYGRALRKKVVTGEFAIDTCLIMHGVAAFEEDVSAYPAVTIIRRGVQGEVVAGDAGDDFNEDGAAQFMKWAAKRNDATPFATRSAVAARLPHWHTTTESWPDGSPATLAWLEDLGDRLPVLEDEETGTRIRIGVATGADAVYVTQDATAAEPERMLQLAMPADIKSGTFAWTGHYLVNPWDEDGLVDLEAWPKLEEYLRRHGTAVRGRAVAKNNKQRWYRTIDRVTMSVTKKPKLLLEDLKARASPVLEPGGHYPHHNLYYLVSDGWDLEVLGGLLLSEVVERQVAAYCVKMRGRTLRFQAQYLRRVRAPRPGDIGDDVKDALRKAFADRDRGAATAAALSAYGMDTMPQ